MQRILEVAIGLVLVFAVFAVLVSSITEVVSALFKMRYNNLLEGITRLFGEHDTARPLTDKVMAHPLIASSRRGKSSPSYIDAVTFATALLDEASSAQARADAAAATSAAGSTADATSTPPDTDEVAAWLATVPGAAGTSLLALWNRADRKLDRFQHEVEDWFDRQMERASGWYGKKAQWVMVGTGLVLAVALNVSAMCAGSSRASSTRRPHSGAPAMDRPRPIGTAPVIRRLPASCRCASRRRGASPRRRPRPGARARGGNRQVRPTPRRAPARRARRAAKR